MSAVAITGATGFIGGRLVERLLAQGREVRCLVRASSRVERLRELGAGIAVVDLERGGGLQDALAGASSVLHVAGAVRAWTGAEFARSNVETTRLVAESAARAGLERLVLVSSLAAAGPSAPGEPRVEERESAPICDYGRSKLEAERALARAAGDALSFSIVRPSAVYGPGDRDFLELFKLGSGRSGLVPYVAPPDARLSMVHVDDVVELVLRALERAPAGRAYFASDGGAHTWEDIIHGVGAALGRELRAVRIPPALMVPAALAVQALRPFRARPPVLCLDKLRQARQRGWLCSFERARSELGFEPRFTLREGLAQTAAWYRAAGWISR